MRPLRLVLPTNLQPGKMYLIREKRPEYAHLNSKGVFVQNVYPHSPHQCTMSHFTHVQVNNNPHYIDLRLQSVYWNYYEADAVAQAYTNMVLRDIIGDASFTM